MNPLGQILLALLIIAALQGLLAVLAVGIALALVVGIIWRPAQTLRLLAFFALLAGLDAHPWATIGAIAALFGAFLIASRAKRPASAAKPHLLLLSPPDRPGDGS